MLRRDLDALQTGTFDVVVIGGGITGACLAHEAALRGLSVALIEARDFGAATSAASSKVLHGGIRYLQQLRIGKLRESAFERCYFQRIAPHLTRFVPFLIPTYRGFVRGRLALRGALTAYELLSAGQNTAVRDPSKRVPPSRCCSKAETLALAPVLGAQPGLTGSCVLYESHMHSSERMTLAFVKSAARHGAQVANYLSAQRLLTANGAACGLLARDEMGGATIEIRARAVANAAGPWIPALNQAFGVAGLTRAITSFSKGVHVLTRPLTEKVALVMPTTKRQQRVLDRGGRHLFVIPWRHRSLIGTSNTPADGALHDVRVSALDVVELLADINAALPGIDLSPADVEHAFAGLYPLTEEQVQPDVYQATGTYQVVDHRALGDLEGLVSVLGMKYTTARRLAVRAADLIVRKIGARAAPTRSATTPLVGGDIEDLPAFLASAIERHRHRADAGIVQHLVEHYGTETDAVLATAAPGLNPTARLSPDRECLEAEVAFAVEREMGLRLDDVVLRRTGLGTVGHPGTACLRRCGDIMAGLLGWSPAQAAAEVDRTAALLTVEGLPGR
ncbi:MAG: glycerol-3-phosphate dehydrogenase/oxidase [Gemmatimonadetes bacterium]|nr:glycerol-3-phosphate dehydrogenase/oxidase [Gemmatimonadota bacterium]